MNEIRPSNIKFIIAYIKGKIKIETRKEFFIRTQNSYLFTITKALGADGKHPEEILKELDHPTPVKTAEQIEKEVEEKFAKYLKR